MKYHASFSTIIISLIVLLVFAAAAVFTVSNLSMTSPTLIITEKLLEEIAAADSDLSLSFGSIDRSFRDGITIRDIEVSYKGRWRQFRASGCHIPLCVLHPSS